MGAQILIDKLHFEKLFWPRSPHIAGIDEAGRGAWAGPVVAAAVIFSPDVFLLGVDDSKKLSPKKREELFDQIRSRCLCYGIGFVESDVIDRINILEASKQAMLMAVANLSIQPDLLLIDGNMTLETEFKQKCIIGGDARSHSIAAASILAKVTRDRLMVELSKAFPDYGFEKHKGYGTAVHQKAIERHGCLSFHRKSYAPIAALQMNNKGPRHV